MPARTRRPLRALAGALATGALAELAPAGQAAAAPAAPAPGPATTLLSAAGGAGEQQRVATYWTPERMRAAVPLDVSRTAEQQAGGTTAGARPLSATTALSEVVGRGSRTTAAPAQTTGVPWSGGGAVARIAGKVFFVSGGRPYVCSGSSVESGNRSTVVTAGHCLTEGGVDATDVAFVPGYSAGNAPYGTWVATALSTTSQWRDGDQATAAAMNYDVGFAVVAPRPDGARLADVVGAFPIAFDAPAGQRLAVFGYPSSAPYDGQSLQHCRGRGFADTSPQSTDLGVNCFMTGGSSGGPWLSGFDGSTGTVTSVVSFSYAGADSVLYGPRFGAVVREVYTAASSRAVA
ncbi:peptidase [Kineococcus glutinatus]|uniref:Peptidase n=1 Tax=Kineococcus glutinatus TaxID=1070872 RepID=A0ABP9HQK3_9ACTN